MNRSTGMWVRGAAIGLAAAGAAMALQAQDQPRSERVERFSGSVRLKDANVRVSVQTHLVPNRLKVAWPEGGATLLVELRGGKATSVIDGERLSRKAGEFWVVPAKSSFSIETDDDSAALGVTVIEAP